eukprot:jgi/Hompol1/6878/HPOL_002993-RA
MSDDGNTEQSRQYKRRPSFDPGDFLLLNDPQGPSSQLQQCIYDHRFRLFNLFEHMVPKPKNSTVTESEEAECFNDFVETLCTGMCWNI